MHSPRQNGTTCTGLTTSAHEAPNCTDYKYGVQPSTSAKHCTWEGSVHIAVQMHSNSLRREASLDSYKTRLPLLRQLELHFSGLISCSKPPSPVISAADLVMLPALQQTSPVK